MKNRTLLLTLAILLIATALLSAGIPREFQGNSEILPVKGKVTKSYPSLAKGTAQLMPMGVNGVLDTLSWLDGGNVNFGGWTDDYFAEYFVPAADGILHSITFNMSDLPNVSGGGMNVWIYKSNYNWPEINTVDIADAGDAWLGYYDTADGPAAFGEADEWHGGGIDSLDEAIPGKIYDPLGEKVWPMFGAGTVSIEPTADDKGFYTVNLMDLGSEYEFTMGDTFLVVILFTGFDDLGDGADYRMGFYASQKEVDPQPGLKFYNVNGNATGRLGDNDWGWYIRSYIWDWRCNVEYTGDRGPVISDVTDLATTLSTEPRTVEAVITDDNPAGGAAGVASANLVISYNGGEFTSIPMTNTSGDIWAAEIPAQTTGTSVTYYVEATDVADLYTKELTSHNYFYYGKSAGAQFLLLLDGLGATGYPSQYYFYGTGVDLPYDIWAYGAATAELLDLYTTVFEITTFGPAYGNAVAVKTWLDQGGKNYLLAGDEVLGGYYGWPGTVVSIPAGDNDADAFFEYLGVTEYYGDINYGASGDQNLPWRIYPVAGDAISGALADSLTAYGVDTLLYDPYYEVGATNWLDGFGVATDVTVCFKAVPNDSLSAAYGTDPLAIGIYKEDATLDNKTVFLGFDPLSINSAPYAWWSAYPASPMAKTIEWFGELTGIFETENVVNKYQLNQNYPNPFNPTTSISYSIPRDEFVRLTVYNMLGQKVRTLVSSRQVAKSYRVTWDGTDDNGLDVPSGVYFYNIQAGSFVSTKKMILMK